MADRFDVVEVGGQGRRPIGLLVVLVLLGVSVAGLIAGREPEQPAPRQEPVREADAPTRSLTRTEGRPHVLHPETDGKGEVARMRVVFPDGMRATVRYPADLRLDRLGVRPYQGLWVDGLFRHLTAPSSGEMEITKGGEPIRSYAANVTLWPRQAGAGQYGQVLLFAFGRWRMAMYDRPPGLTFDQRVAVAEGLRGRVTDDGFLVLSGSERVHLARPGDSERGEPVGPQLWFGAGVRETVMLIPTPGCEQARGLPGSVRMRGRPVGERCRDGVRVIAAGDQEFIGRALDGIRISVK